MNNQRINHAALAQSIASPFVTAIIGPRRVGKSYFVKNFAEQHPMHNWLFFNMDQMMQRQRAAAGQLEVMIREAARRPVGMGAKLWVVIDEAQKCPAIFDQIKILYDDWKDQHKIKFIITGSAVLSLHQLSAESLAGRIDLHELHAFNLREATLLREKTLPMNSLLDALREPENLADLLHTLSPFKPLLEESLIDLLCWGGFPELLTLATDSEKSSYLYNYLQTYLEKDVRAIETISDIDLYRNMLDVLGEQTGSVRDDNRIVSSLGCTRDTLKKYRGYLAATLLYTEVYPFIGSSLKRLIKSPKGYLANNGLVSLLTGISDFQVLEKTGIIGHRLENWFLNELKIWLARQPLRQEVRYWRTSSGTEVDFVVVKKPEIFPFEVTYTAQIARNKVRSLKTFLQEEPRARWGYYIYRGAFAIDRENRIVFIPCWAVG